MFDNFYPERLEPLKAAVGVLVALLAFALPALRRRRPETAAALAVVAGLVGLGAFWGYGQVFRNGPHLGDFVFHYFGAKYLPEVGYAEWVEPFLVVDEEDQKLWRSAAPYPHLGEVYRRNTPGFPFVPVEECLREAPRHKAKFTPERWAAFKRDYADMAGWGRFRDHYYTFLLEPGLNVTPAWAATMRPLVSAPLTRERTFNLLALDFAWILLAAAALFAAFGWHGGGLAVAFLGLNFFTDFYHTSMSFGRYDWFAFAVFAACFLHKEKWACAGACLAVAAAFRVWPGVFAFGIFFQLLWGLHDAKPWKDGVARTRFVYDCGGHLRFLTAFGLVLGAFVLYGAWANGGFRIWEAFFAKIDAYNHYRSLKQVGFSELVTFPWPGDEHNAARERWETPIRCVQAATLLLTFVAVRGRRPLEAFAWGLCPLFFLLTPVFYYFIVLAVPFTALASRWNDRGGPWRIAAVFGLSGLTGVWYVRATTPALLYDNFAPTGAFVLAFLCVLASLLFLPEPEEVSR